MTRYFLALALILWAGSAAAERIRDWSLSPEETMREPDITATDDDALSQGTWSNQPKLYQGEGTRPLLPQAYPQQGELPAAQSFMAGYCGQDSAPIVKNRMYQQNAACMDDIKAKACAGFAALPDEAKPVLDSAASCSFSEAMEGMVRAGESHCAQLQLQQLRLAKKYWNSQDTAYLILFLPDMVSNPMMFCMQR